MTGLRRRSPRPRSTVRSGRSAMEGIRHRVPLGPTGAHAWSLLAGEEIAAASPRRGATKAGSDPATHRGFECHLDGGERNLLPTGGGNQSREHRSRAAREDVDTPTLTLPQRLREIFGEQINNRAVIAGAAVVGGDANVGTGESRGWKQLRCSARALQHSDLAAAHDQGSDDAGKDRDAEAAGDAHGRST